MKIVYLSNDDIIKSTNFAVHTVELHYQRMWESKEDGFRKICIGKLGEIAVSKYLAMIGVSSKPSFRIDTGIDTSDLIVRKNLIEVKTKNFSRVQLPPLEDIYLHIPIDQHGAMICHKVDAIIAVCVHTDNRKDIKDWVDLTSIKALVIGGITFAEFSELKVFHQKGKECAPGFVATIDCYGVTWSKLYDIDVLLSRIKHFKKNNHQLNFPLVNQIQTEVQK